MKLLLFLKFLRKVFRKYRKHWSKDFVFSGRRDVTIHVLGNGPSLNGSLHLIKKEDRMTMVNFAVLTDLFFQLKPSYLCLADPAFFEKTDSEDIEKKKVQMLQKLEEVHWDLSIVIPVGARHEDLVVNTRYISFKFVNNARMDYSIKFMRMFFYKRNIAIPLLQNVVILALYIGLQRGYGKIYIHGVDSDSYKKICINQDNEMVMRELHYYGYNDVNLNDSKTNGFAIGRLYKRLACEVAMFRSYVDLASYADYLGIRVINASPNSMIDAFERYVPETGGMGE